MAVRGGGGGGARGGMIAPVKPSGGTQGWGLPGVEFFDGSTNAPSTATDSWSPFWVVGQPIILNTIGFAVTAAPASNATLFRAICAADQEMQPQQVAPLINDSVAVASGFTGNKTTTVNQLLPPGAYLVGINPDVAMTLRSWRSLAASVQDDLSANFFQQGVLARAAAAFATPPAKWTTAGWSGGGVGVTINRMLFRWTLA